MTKSLLPLWMLIAVICLLWLPLLLAQGMFVDGVFDALFAHNLVQGVTTFWNPHSVGYSKPEYWDNPPLSMYLLSLWFRVFGDYFWSERVYSFSCALVQFALVAALWRSYFYNFCKIKKYFWLPLFLLLCCPIVEWCYSNNLMENTMSIFTTASVLIFVLFLKRNWNLFVSASLSGILIFLAIISKGPVGLFPLVAPICFMLGGNQFNLNKIAMYTCIQAAIFGAVFFVTFSMDEAGNFLRHYLDLQLLPALHNPESNALLHWPILNQLFWAALPMLSLAIISICICSKKFSKNITLREALIFIAIAFCASMPILLSAKQHRYYLLPSFPFYAMGFACVIVPLVQFVFEFGSRFWCTCLERVYQGACVLCIGISIALCVTNANKIARDRAILMDIQDIQEFLKNEKLIHAEPKLYYAWILRAYLNRMHDQKLCMPNEVVTSEFFMTEHGTRGIILPKGARKIYSGQTIDLYNRPIQSKEPS